MSLEPPTFVELKVTMTEPMMKGATQAASPKPATLETGHTLRVLERPAVARALSSDEISVWQ